MARWVCLLRGINVGGKNKLPMADLRAICEALWPDCNPRTMIASGNLIVTVEGTAAELANALGKAILQKKTACRLRSFFWPRMCSARLWLPVRFLPKMGKACTVSFALSLPKLTCQSMTHS